MGFPTKNDHFGVFWGYHHLRKHPYLVKLARDRKHDRFITPNDGLNVREIPGYFREIQVGEIL